MPVLVPGFWFPTLPYSSSVELLETIRQFLRQHQVKPCSLLIAVSGGPDSTGLLVSSLPLREDGFTLHAGHVNHHLRGEASDQDEAFVRQLCALYKVPLDVADGQLDPETIRHHGLEAAARDVRYRELERMRIRTRATYIVTAHHRDDQAETVLMRLITGSGIERLAGIAPVSPHHIIRPLLEVPRSALAEVARDHGLQPRLDSSNVDERFLRNRIRNELLPLLQQYNPRIADNLARLAHHVRDRSRAFDQLFTTAATAWVRQDSDSSAFPLDTLPEDPWLRRAILWREIRRLDPPAREISSADLRRLADALPNLRRTTVTRRLELVRDANSVVLRRISRQREAFSRMLRPGTPVEVNGLTFHLERHAAAQPPYTNNDRSFQVFQLPGDAENAPFVVRTRRRGERFQPLGFGQEKKLAEFLIDRKIPRDLRDQLPLLVWQDQVVWVAGVEVSEKFKVTEPWRDAYRVSIVRNDHPAEVHH